MNILCVSIICLHVTYLFFHVSAAILHPHFTNYIVPCKFLKTVFDSSRLLTIVVSAGDITLSYQCAYQVSDLILIHDVRWNGTLGEREKGTGHLIILNGHNDVENLISILEVPWNVRGRYIIIIYSEDNLQILFDRFFSWKIVNLVALIPNSYGSDIVWTVYHQPLYSLGGDCSSHRALVAGRVSDGNLPGFFSEHLDEFLDTRHSNMYGCPITVSSMEDPPYTIVARNSSGVHFVDGIDIRLLETISRKLGSFLKFRPENPVHSGGYSVNGSWYGVLADVVDEKSDIGASSMMLNLDRYKVMDAVFPHCQDRVIWIVKHAERRPHWKGPIVAFTSTVWMLVVLCYVLLLFLVYRKRSLSYSVTAMCSPTLPPVLPRFLIVIIMCASILASLYKSFLISLLLDPGYENQIDSIQEILASRPIYAYRIGLTPFIMDNNEEIISALKLNHKISSNSLDMLRLVVNESAAGLSVEVITDYYLRSYFLARYDGPVVHKVNPPFLIFYSCIYMPKGHPLLNIINEIVIRLLDAGLVLKWKEDIQHSNQLRGSYRHNRRSKISFALKARHLLGAFYVLIIGLGISVLTFTVEINIKNKGFVSLSSIKIPRPGTLPRIKLNS